MSVHRYTLSTNIIAIFVVLELLILPLYNQVLIMSRCYIFAGVVL